VSDVTETTGAAAVKAPVKISEQASVPWSVVFSVSISSLRRRIMRSLVAMVGVILAIAFLCYMLVNHEITQALIAANVNEINAMLQKAGVDPYKKGGADTRMFILIGLSLITCLVGITNAMLMSVTERVKEIGTLKCLGALDSFIVKTFFVESLLQGVLGTVLGIVGGLVVGLAVSFGNFGMDAFRYCPWLKVVGVAFMAFLIGTVISMLASIAPAYWAARKQPVEALRVEE
jgi:putative ABC transport system permease protein